MRTSMGIGGACLAAMVLAGGARGATTEPAPPAVSEQSRAEVEEFLKKLGRAEFGEERALEAGLEKLGPGSYSLLQAALADPKTDKATLVELEDAFPTIVRKLNPRAARQAEARKWQARVLLEAYNAHGEKNATWDELVRSAIADWGSTPEGGAWRRQDWVQRMEAWKKAYDAGCRDAMVVHFYLVSSSYVKLPPEARQMALDAAKRYERSNYPGMVKLWGYAFATKAVISQPMEGPEQRATLMYLFDLQMQEWEGVVRDRDLIDGAVEEVTWSLLNQAKLVGFREEQAQELVLRALDAVPWRAVGEAFRGMRLLKEAQEARGYEWAGMTDPGRLERAARGAEAAGKALERAWRLDPTNPTPCVKMISVEMLASTGRASMEKWYERAVAADPDSVAARGMKLTYLQPRWYGSYDQMIAFGRECLETKRWAARIPQALLTVHQVIAAESGQGGAYFKDAAVWKDVVDVLEGAIAFDPGDMLSHNTLAHLAAISGHKEVARREFAVIGDAVNLEIFGSRKNYEDLRRAAGSE